MTPTREEILKILRENKARLVEKYMPEDRQKTTSFSPHFLNKTTSVAQWHQPYQPHYLILVE